MSPQSLPPAGPPQAHRTISYKHSPRCPPKVCPLLAHLRHTGPSPINTHPDVPPKSAPAGPPQAHRTISYTLTQMSPSPRCPPQSLPPALNTLIPRCPPMSPPPLIPSPQCHSRHPFSFLVINAMNNKRVVL